VRVRYGGDSKPKEGSKVAIIPQKQETDKAGSKKRSWKNPKNPEGGIYPLHNDISNKYKKNSVANGWG